MTSNLESKMFQAGAAARLNELVKEAGLFSGLAKAPSAFRSGVRRGAMGVQIGPNTGWAKQLGGAVGRNPIKSTIGAAGVAGGAGAIAGGGVTKAVMNSRFNTELAGMDASLKKTLEGYAGSQTWTDKLRDLFAYIFNGKALAGNKYNDIMNYAAANKTNFSPFMQKKLQPRFNAAAAATAPAVKAN